MPVVMRLVGGTGNQLFIYARGLALSKKYDVQLLDQCIQYGCSLDKFNISLSFTDSSQGRGIGEPSLRFDPNPEIEDPCTLTGYYQCERYFLNVEDELRSELTLRETPSSVARQYAEAISRTTSAFVHIRRGDYLTWASAILGVLPLDYYQKATKHIAERVGSPHFFVFSDDPEWVRQNLILPYPVTFVHTTLHEDLWLMSKCSHAVIANSTFSWWGAWLGAGRAGIVVAPQRWFAEEGYLCGGPSVEDAKDIVPKRWALL